MVDALISAPRAHREEWRTPHAHQEGWRPPWVERVSDVLRDARFAMRIWTRECSLTLTVLATLVACLGGNTVIFSIVRSVLLKPLPIAGADRIVLVSNLYPKFGFGAAGPGVGATSVPDYFDRRATSTRSTR
jgi:hypothetical protein